MFHHHILTLVAFGVVVHLSNCSDLTDDLSPPSTISDMNSFNDKQNNNSSQSTSSADSALEMASLIVSNTSIDDYEYYYRATTQESDQQSKHSEHTLIGTIIVVVVEVGIWVVLLVALYLSTIGKPCKPQPLDDLLRQNRMCIGRWSDMCCDEKYKVF